MGVGEQHQLLDVRSLASAHHHGHSQVEVAG